MNDRTHPYRPGDIVRHTPQMARILGGVGLPINGAVLRTREFSGGQLLTVHWSDSLTREILHTNVEPDPKAVREAEGNGLTTREFGGSVHFTAGGLIATMPVSRILLGDEPCPTCHGDAPYPHVCPDCGAMDDPR